MIGLLYVLFRYTLWNAEYRIMLMRNLEISPSDDLKKRNSSEDNEASEEKVEKGECLCDSVAMECCTEESEKLDLQSCLGDLAPEVMSYIQQLESELSTAKKVRLCVCVCVYYLRFCLAFLNRFL